jgi:hypothetical protein
MPSRPALPLFERAVVRGLPQIGKHEGGQFLMSPRGSGNGEHTTGAHHMPSSHRRYADWTIGRARRDAALIGPAIAALCDLILEQRPHPEQGFRSCLGILRPARPFGIARLKAAAARSTLATSSLCKMLKYGRSFDARLGFACRTPLPIGSVIVQEAGVAITPNKL